MSKKSAKIALLLADCEGQPESPHYLGYFKCFNEELFFEAHDVLEELWLRDKQSSNYAFYKGLIQLAGAFVHLQKERLGPAVALFDLASANLRKYPSVHDRFGVAQTLALIEDWKGFIEAHSRTRNPLKERKPPKLSLES